MEGQTAAQCLRLPAPDPPLFILSITIRTSRFLPAKKFPCRPWPTQFATIQRASSFALRSLQSPPFRSKQGHGFVQPPTSAPAILVFSPRTYFLSAGMGDTRDHTGTKRRSSDDIEDSRKKTKMGGVPLGGDGGGEKLNPYLAHMYDGDADGADGTVSASSAFAGMKTRNTTAKQAETIEDSDSNPFTERPHTTQYFRILESRRDLPVQKQR